MREKCKNMQLCSLCACANDNFPRPDLFSFFVDKSKTYGLMPIAKQKETLPDFGVWQCLVLHSIFNVVLFHSIYLYFNIIYIN
jgi:hypothetical protein